MKLLNEYFVPVLVLCIAAYSVARILRFIVDKVLEKRKKNEYNDL